MMLKIDAKFEEKLTCVFKKESFTRAHESLKNGFSMGCFYPKKKMYELKTYRDLDGEFDKF